MSLNTVEHMIWHQSHNAVDEVMTHLSNDEAWKHFNNVHPYFSVELRNVRFELCIDRINPSKSFVAPFSCWPVILTIFNLPPGICMRQEFMFLSIFQLMEWFLVRARMEN
jgi:hypothetical protein